MIDPRDMYLGFAVSPISLGLTSDGRWFASHIDYPGIVGEGTTSLEARVDLVRKLPEDYVGTTCVPLDLDTLRQAIDRAGGGGRLVLHPEQWADLRDPTAEHPAMATAMAVANWRVDARESAEVADGVEPVNGGRDWLGTYTAPSGQRVRVCSRRVR